MSRHERLTATALGQTLAYAESICRAEGFCRFHGIKDRTIDVRVITAALLDLGAPIADWRNDPRVTVPANAYRVRPTDMFGNARGDYARDTYAGEGVEALRGVHREYQKRLIDWLFADKPPVDPKSDAFRVGAWLIHHMPSVEEFIDAAQVGVAA